MLEGKEGGREGYGEGGRGGWEGCEQGGGGAERDVSREGEELRGM